MTTDSTSAAAGDRRGQRRFFHQTAIPLNQLRTSMLQTLRRNGISTLKYLGTTEVHTYAFSVAANAILSFFPAAVLLLTLSRRCFHSPAMVSAIKRMLAAYLPSNQDSSSRRWTPCRRHTKSKCSRS